MLFGQSKVVWLFRQDGLCEKERASACIRGVDCHARDG